MSGRRESKAAEMRKQAANVRESIGADIVHRPATDPPAPRLSFGSTDSVRGTKRSKNAASIELAKIVADPGQPRKEFPPEALARLAESLKARGQLQPARVRWDPDLGKYVVIAGERRFRAAQLAGLATLECVIHEGSPTADDVLVDQLVENCLRQDLTPGEEARAFRALIDRKGWSGRKLAEELALEPSGVSRTLALLKLPDSVLALVDAGKVARASAYELTKLEDPARQEALAEAIAGEGLPYSSVVEAVREVTRPAPKPAPVLQLATSDPLSESPAGPPADRPEAAGSAPSPAPVLQVATRDRLSEPPPPPPPPPARPAGPRHGPSPAWREVPLTDLEDFPLDTLVRLHDAGIRVVGELSDTIVAGGRLEDLGLTGHAVAEVFAALDWFWDEGPEPAPWQEVRDDPPAGGPPAEVVHQVAPGISIVKPAVPAGGSAPSPAEAIATKPGELRPAGQGGEPKASQPRPTGPPVVPGTPIGSPAKLVEVLAGGIWEIAVGSGARLYVVIDPEGDISPAEACRRGARKADEGKTRLISAEDLRHAF